MKIKKWKWLTLFTAGTISLFALPFFKITAGNSPQVNYQVQVNNLNQEMKLETKESFSPELLDDYTYRNLEASGGNSGVIVTDAWGHDSLLLWGENNENQLLEPDSLKQDFYYPTVVNFSNESKIKSFAMGRYSVIAITTDEENRDHLYMWGRTLLKSNKYWKVPQEIIFEEPTIKFADLGNFREFRNGTSYDSEQNFAAVVTTDQAGKDHLYTQGANGWGQLGNGTYDGEGTEEFAEIELPVGQVKDLQLGAWNSAIVIANEGQDDQIYVWGQNYRSGLGLEEDVDPLSPTLLTLSLSGKINELALASNNGGVILETSDGDEHLIMWGDGNYNALESRSNSLPTEITIMTEHKEHKITEFGNLELGMKNGAVIVPGYISYTNEDRIFAWGSNETNQIDDKSRTIEYATPTLMDVVAKDIYDLKIGSTYWRKNYGAKTELQTHVLILNKNHDGELILSGRGSNVTDQLGGNQNSPFDLASTTLTITNCDSKYYNEPYLNQAIYDEEQEIEMGTHTGNFDIELSLGYFHLITDQELDEDLDFTEVIFSIEEYPEINIAWESLGWTANNKLKLKLQMSNLEIDKYYERPTLKIDFLGKKEIELPSFRTLEKTAASEPLFSDLIIESVSSNKASLNFNIKANNENDDQYLPTLLRYEIKNDQELISKQDLGITINDQEQKVNLKIQNLVPDFNYENLTIELIYHDGINYHRIEQVIPSFKTMPNDQPIIKPIIKYVNTSEIQQNKATFSYDVALNLNPNAPKQVITDIQIVNNNSEILYSKMEDGDQNLNHKGKIRLNNLKAQTTYDDLSLVIKYQNIGQETIETISQSISSFKTSDKFINDPTLLLITDEVYSDAANWNLKIKFNDWSNGNYFEPSIEKIVVKDSLEYEFGTFNFDFTLSEDNSLKIQIANLVPNSSYGDLKFEVYYNDGKESKIAIAYANSFTTKEQELDQGFSLGIPALIGIGIGGAAVVGGGITLATVLTIKHKRKK